MTATRFAKFDGLMADWKFRHLFSLAIVAALVWGFALMRPEWSPMHKWNRAFGDASFLVVAIVMVLGPLSRLFRPFARTLPWRRELGVWGFLAGVVHAGFILVGWVDLEIIRLFGFQFHPQLFQYVMVDKGFGLGNVIGILALVYGLILALTSNDISQKWLGMGIWKYFQQGAYILWSLLVAHTAYFLFLHFLDFHRSIPEPNIIRWPFVGLVVFVLALQTWASLKTWRLRKNRAAFPA